MSVTVNPQTITAQNTLSLGIQTDYANWSYLVTHSTFKNLIASTKPKLIRVHGFTTNPMLEPCTNWATRTYNWAGVDSLVQAIYDIGAEPFFTLGWARIPNSGGTLVPPNMQLSYHPELNGGLPQPTEWAEYCREWVKHFKQTGKLVRFYEIWNEPWMYIINNTTAMGYYRDTFNAAANAMRAENPNVQLGFDGIDRQDIFNFWLNNGGAQLDFLSFHKYDNDSSDATLLNSAESKYLTLTSNYYLGVTARQAYYNRTGRLLPVFCTETNLNVSVDTRIHTIVGAVWTALMLYGSVNYKLDASVYYESGGSSGWQNGGFGLIETNTNTPYIAYYVWKMIGENLEVNDPIVQSSTSNANLRVLAWKHAGNLNILLINKSNTNIPVLISGISGNFTYSYIDASHPTPATATTTGNVTLNGYTVMLLQQATPTTTTYRFQHWDDINQTSPEITVTT